MAQRGLYAGGLVDLAKLNSADERRVVFRQAMTALAQSGTGEGPSLLDGLSANALAAGVRAALSDKLIDSLDWLAPEAAGAALYELAAALPNGNEQRDLGRRVLGALLSADARTFVVVAKRMALGAGKGLATQAVRARIALVVELPIAHAVPDGPLALALVSRQKLSRDWIALPSAGALVDRRMVARLLERAAREAARRAQQGDDFAVRAFASDAVARAFARLLADRESLVWRHVAVARGLLAPWMPAFDKAIQEGASDKLSPTEWRRAATSSAAMIAVDPESATRTARAILRLREKDGGVPAALLWGMARAVESEPDAAIDVIREVIANARPDIIEAFGELVGDVGGGEPLEDSIASLPSGGGPTSGDAAAELDTAPETRRGVDWREAARDKPFRIQVARALDAFATQGPKAAYDAAKEVFVTARGVVETLEALGDEESRDGQSGRAAKGAVMTSLRDADVGLLERDVLGDLLRLGSATEVVTHERELVALKAKLARWIVARESHRNERSDLALGQRRLRALLHLVDGDVKRGEDPAAQEHFLLATNMLLDGFGGGVAPALSRANTAALARALEGLVRGEVLEPIDALLVAIHSVTDPAALSVLGEASMDEDLRHAFTRAAQWLVAMSPTDEDDHEASPLDALATWSKDLVLDPSSRAEAFRTAVVHLHQALSAIDDSASLRSLSGRQGAQPDLIVTFEESLAAISYLSTSARARLDSSRATESVRHTESGLSLAVSRVLSGAQPSLGGSAVDLIGPALLQIPASIAALVKRTMSTLDGLPVEPPEGVVMNELAFTELPSWLPARRILGGFYVMRPLGKGGSASVFVVHRAEDRREPNPERFALKVPDYSAGAARSLSEAEFMQIFRSEASALITLPQQPNLAKFVTFDMAARPKPILVMELVEGPSLEHVISSRALTTARWFAVLDDVLAGLEAMHASGVAHLDVKPSNVVLRGNPSDGVAVLVDFGLAGRNIRPGCATGPYGAPEVWGALGPGVVPDAPKADVYAFACLAFEVLTGVTLFFGDSELQQVAQHLAHDGFPERLRTMGKDPALAPLAEVLFSALRRDPKNRPNASRLRTDLRKIGPALGRARWPLPT